MEITATSDDYQSQIREMGQDLALKELKLKILARMLLERDKEIESLKSKLQAFVEQKSSNGKAKIENATVGT